MRKGGTQPKSIRAGKNMLPTREPMRPTIMLNERIMVLSDE